MLGMKQKDMRLEMQRRKSHYSMILNLFQDKHEVTNLDLAKITFRYSARLGELRKDGHKILAQYERPGVWRYSYLGHKDDLGE